MFEKKITQKVFGNSIRLNLLVFVPTYIEGKLRKIRSGIPLHAHNDSLSITT